MLVRKTVYHNVLCAGATASTHVGSYLVVPDNDPEAHVGVVGVVFAIIPLLA